MTRVGVLSDSHGRHLVTGIAVRRLLDGGATVLLHLGDIETEAVIDELVGHPARIVFGNCDLNASALGCYARNVGVIVDDPAGELVIADRRIVFTHGHSPPIMRQALETGADYLLHGHSHELRDERIGSTRVINPGALFRAPLYTVVILDPATDELDVLEIPRSG